MPNDVRGDILFFLALSEGVLALFAAYAIVLLALYRAPYDQWVPHAMLFAIAAIALVCTSLIADFHQRRSRSIER